MFWIVMFLAQAAAVPSQTERGEALFLDAQQGCANCHALKGKGTAVGPDLTGLGRLAPQAIAMAARSTVTQYVQVVKLKSGGSTSFKTEHRLTTSSRSREAAPLTTAFARYQDY